MAKERTNKKHLVSFRKEYILWVVILLLVIAQGISAWYIFRLVNRPDTDITMRYLLRTIEEDRYKYPVIDVAQNRVYIPEARIYLPLNETSRDMRYEYHSNSAVQGAAKTLTFSTSSVVGRQTGEEFALCDRIVTLAHPSEVQRFSNEAVGMITPTKDGLSDIYTYSGEPCWNQERYDKLRQDLVDAVKAAQNY